jgi:secreted Zn-dependent insulinase-like peptidase
MYAKVWLKMFNKSFLETKNMAEKLKQEISISLGTNCIHLNAWGYNDTIGLLMLKALEDMVAYKPKNKNRFENICNEMK